MVLDLHDQPLPAAADGFGIGIGIVVPRKPDDPVGGRADGRNQTHVPEVPLTRPPLGINHAQPHLLAHAAWVVEHQRGHRAGFLSATPRHSNAALAPLRRAARSHRAYTRPRRGIPDQGGGGWLMLRLGPFLLLLLAVITLRTRRNGSVVDKDEKFFTVEFASVSSVSVSVDGRGGPERVEPCVVHPRRLRVRRLYIRGGHVTRRGHRPEPEPVVRAEEGMMAAAPAFPHPQRLAHAVLLESQRGGQAPGGDPPRV